MELLWAVLYVLALLSNLGQVDAATQSDICVDKAYTQDQCEDSTLADCCSWAEVSWGTQFRCGIKDGGNPECPGKQMPTPTSAADSLSTDCMEEGKGYESSDHTYGEYENIDSPSKCMELCQKGGLCKQWDWVSGGSDTTNRCSLYGDGSGVTSVDDEFKTRGPRNCDSDGGGLPIIGDHLPEVPEVPKVPEVPDLPEMPDAPDGICFSSLSLVTLANNAAIPVSQLKPGDYINSVNSKGDVTSTPFLGWLHHDEKVTTTFLNIATETGNRISISPRHLLMVTDNVDEEPSMKMANTVSPGDYLLSGVAGLVQVKSVTSQVLTGVYAPLTSTGTLLVDDLLASCYAHIGSHRLAHLAASPFRIFPQILQVEGGMRRYLEIVGDIFLKFVDPLTSFASGGAEQTDYYNTSCVTTCLVAGLMPLAFLTLKMRGG